MQDNPSLRKICGLDEAGRGPLAGPIVAAAVILAEPARMIVERAGSPLRDGKTLSRLQRQRIFDSLIKGTSTVIHESISVQDIDKHGIGWANRECFIRLMRKAAADSYIIDGNLKIPSVRMGTTVQSVIDADADIPEVIFAGIAAKVLRDAMMLRLHADFPQYGWDRNAGYGTREHISAIRTYGISNHHRSAFVASVLRNSLP